MDMYLWTTCTRVLVGLAFALICQLSLAEAVSSRHDSQYAVSRAEFDSLLLQVANMETNLKRSQKMVSRLESVVAMVSAI